MAIIELYLSTEVAANTIEADAYIPGDGKAFKILELYGESAYTTNSSVGIIWIYDHGTESEDPIWTIEGAGVMPISVRNKTKKTNADGVRKLGLCLDNGLSGPLYMSGYARLWVED